MKLSTFQPILFWLPKAVHWTMVFLPFLVLAGIYNYLGPIPAAIAVAGAIVSLYKRVLYPQDYAWETSRYTTPAFDSPEIRKKKVAVIGAGPGGVVTCKELKEEGHDVTCFDASPRIGGTFANYFWPEGRLTSSPYVTAFSSYEPARKEDGTEDYLHHSAEEYVDYLQDYAKHFGINNDIKLLQKVVNVYKDDSKFWLRVEDIPTKQERVEGPFDHVALATGSFHEKFIPKIPGLDTFTGKMLHTRDFASDEPDRTVDEAFGMIAGKRIVAVGLGESMSDILGIVTRKMMKPVSYAACAIRAGAFVIPRTNPLTGVNNDFDSTRLRYALPKFLHNLTFFSCATLSGINQPKVCGSSVRRELLTNVNKEGPAFVKTTKSDDFVESVVDGKLEIKCSIDRIEGSTVYFKDGSSQENIDALCFGTGFRAPSFPFMDELSFPSLSKPAVDRYMRIFDPEQGAGIGFIALGIRPLIGSIPTAAEMQARVFALVVSGKLQLPDKETMKSRSMVDKDMFMREFGTHSESWGGLVNWIPYMDSMAREIGCLPKNEWLLSRPMLGYRLVCGPMTSFHYRLVGPGAQPEMALDVINRLPLDATRQRDMLFFMGIHLLVALFAPIFDILSLITAAKSDVMFFTALKKVEGTKNIMTMLTWVLCFTSVFCLYVVGDFIANKAPIQFPVNTNMTLEL